MSRLPRAFQPLLTELTGKPLPNEPRTQCTVLGRVLVNLLVQLALIAVSWTAAAHTWSTSASFRAALWLTVWVVSTLLAGGAVYAVRGVLSHHVFGHDNVREQGLRRALVLAVVRVASIVWLLPAPEAYAKDHGPHHAGTASPGDEDFKTLVRRGLRPGQTVETYRRWFARESRNLVAFARDIRKDASSHFSSRTSVPHRTLFVSVWLVLVALLIANGTYGVGLTLVLVRLFAARANFMQMVSEHTWARAVLASTKYEASLTFHRLVGFALPAPTDSMIRNAVQLLTWTLTMFSLLSVRMGVAASDLKHHGHHHRNAKDDWPNSAFLGTAAREVWGSTREWNEVTFAALSELPTTHWDTLIEALSAERSEPPRRAGQA